MEKRFKIAATWGGTFSPSTTYSVLTEVQDPAGSGIYRSLQDNNQGHALTESSWWTCVCDFTKLNNAVAHSEEINNQCITAEGQRAAAETARHNAEVTRQAAESDRVAAENIRAITEGARNTSETQRQSNEMQRQSAESDRVTAENNRQSAETARQAAEGTPTDPANESGSRWARFNYAEAQRALATAKMKPITYAELCAAKEDAELAAGQWYRITDFVTTVDTSVSAETGRQMVRSAGHPFDIIVMATDSGKLSEEAFAIQHADDTYFANSKLEAWKLKYSLENDTTRFQWADSDGKGVVYEMEDEFGNRLAYDFKNVQFLRFPIKGKSSIYFMDGMEDDSGYAAEITGYNNLFNIAAPSDSQRQQKLGLYMHQFCGYFSEQYIYDDGYEDCWSYVMQDGGTKMFVCLSDGYDSYAILAEVDTAKGCWCHTFGTHANMSQTETTDKTLTGNVQDVQIAPEVLGGGKTDLNYTVFISSNTGTTYKCVRATGRLFRCTFSGNVYRSTFSGNVWYATFSGGVYNSTFSGDVYRSTFSGNVWYSTFSGYLEYNTFSGNVWYSTFSGSVNYSTFSGSVYNSTFSGDVYRSTFSGNVQYSTFSGNVQYSTFSGDLDSNTFSGYLEYNTFSGNIEYSIFSNSVESEVFSNLSNYYTFLN